MEATQGFVIMKSPTKCWKIGLALQKRKKEILQNHKFSDLSSE